MTLRSSFVFVLAAFLAEGCYMSDQDMPGAKSRHCLGALALTAKKFSKEEVVKLRSYEEFYKESQRRRFLEPDYYARDGWGHEYIWEIHANANATSVRIGSAGPNGLWENGQGDDLYVDTELGPETKIGTNLEQKTANE